MWLLLPSTRADMTFPRAESDRLIFLCSFMLVAPTERFWFPTFMTCSISRTLLVTNDERSLTYTPVSVTTSETVGEDTFND
uniref:Uncharacterized protein n=1 Tax=Sander lucioperca TaxID=283035 RepID=A0A8D0D4J6_SANLU